MTSEQTDDQQKRDEMRKSIAKQNFWYSVGAVSSGVFAIIGFSPAISVYFKTGELTQPPFRYDPSIRNNDPPLVKHVHLAGLWLLLGVSQPLLIKFGYNGTHRMLGKMGSLITLGFAYSINKLLAAHNVRMPFLSVLETETKLLFQFLFGLGLYHISQKNYVSHKNCMFTAFCVSTGVAVSRVLLYGLFKFNHVRPYETDLTRLREMKDAPPEMMNVVNTAFVSAQLFQVAFIGSILYLSGQLFKSNMFAFGKQKKENKKEEKWSFSVPNWVILPVMAGILAVDIMWYRPTFGVTANFCSMYNVALGKGERKYLYHDPGSC